MSEAAVEADGVISLYGNGEPLVQKRCFPLVTRTERETATQLIEEGNALGIYWTKGLKCNWNEAVGARQRLIFLLLSTCRSLRRSSRNSRRRGQIGLCQRVGDRDVPCHTSPSLPWNLRQPVRTLAVGSQEAVGLFDRWDVGAIQCSANQVVYVVMAS